MSQKTTGIVIAGASGRWPHVDRGGPCRPRHTAWQVPWILAGALHWTRCGWFRWRHDRGDHHRRLGRRVKGRHVLIDFTRPEGTMPCQCRTAARRAVVIAQRVFLICKASVAGGEWCNPIVMAPNMSVGVNVTLKLLEMAAKAMPVGYDIESLRPTTAQSRRAVGHRPKNGRGDCRCVGA